MLGAIAGDMVGSIYEFNNLRSREFPLFRRESHFTDDTVLTVAVADALMSRGDLGQIFKDYYERYPDAGYGGRFHAWAQQPELAPYNSWGNGAAMRVSPVAYAYDRLERVLDAAEEVSAVTHNHPEGIKGAQATASAIFLARTGETKASIGQYVESWFGYDLSESIDSIREWYRFDESCQGTVPFAIRAFLEAEDVEGTIRNAVSIGGDSDTVACIAGSIAEAYWQGLPASMHREVMDRLDADLFAVTDTFCRRYVPWYGTGTRAS